jgi:hypothetical protein
VKGVAGDIDRGHFGVGDFDPGRIEAFVQFAANGEASGRGGRGDQFDNGAIIDERSPPPVARDEREEALFDLVPFAGAGRQVQDDDGQGQFVGKLLQFDLPKADARAFASPAIGGDRQGMGADSGRVSWSSTRSGSH